MPRFTPQTHSTRTTNLLTFAFFSAWLIASLALAVFALTAYGQDFRGYYAAARALLNGGNPYDYHTLAPILLDATGTVGNNPYYYAPFLAWLVIPFAFLPFHTARVVWMLFNWLAWLWGLFRINQWIKPFQSPLQKWWYFLLSTIIFAWMTWRYEQIGIILLVLLTEGILALKKQQDYLAGFWLALSLVKPNITIIPVSVILIWLIRRKRWRPVFSWAVSISSLMLLPLLYTPDLYAPFLKPNFFNGLFNVLDGPSRIVGHRINTTLYDWLLMMHVPKILAASIHGITFVIGLMTLFACIHKNRALNQVVFAALLVTFTVTPYALQYDYPLLTPIFFWSVSSINHSELTWVNVIGRLLTVFTVSIIFWERPISDGYWIVVNLGVLSGLAWQATQKHL